MELNGTIFLQIFIFLTLLLWLSQTLFAPIMRLFEEREQRIEGAKRIARELSGLADEKSKTFLTQYEKARGEARVLLSEMKHAMDKEFTDALERVKAGARDKLLAADRELGEQETRIREELVGRSAGIADDIVKAMVRRSA